MTVNLSGQRLDVAACHALARAAADGASFRVLDCGDCGIGDAGAAELAEVLILNARLERLYAPANGIGRDGADAVAAGAEARLGPRLRTLDLSDNEKLGDAGAIALARVCRPEVAPSELRLAACGIGDAGARALAGAFFPSRKDTRRASALALHRNPFISAAARLEVATAAREAGVKVFVFS